MTRGEARANTRALTTKNAWTRRRTRLHGWSMNAHRGSGVKPHRRQVDARRHLERFTPGRGPPVGNDYVPVGNGYLPKANSHGGGVARPQTASSTMRRRGRCLQPPSSNAVALCARGPRRGRGGYTSRCARALRMQWAGTRHDPPCGGRRRGAVAGGWRPATPEAIGTKSHISLALYVVIEPRWSRGLQ